LNNALFPLRCRSLNFCAMNQKSTAKGPFIRERSSRSPVSALNACGSKIGTDRANE
jgi:hypothetical protein